MSFAEDHCKTAADVLASARRVQALRQASYKPRPAPRIQPQAQPVLPLASPPAAVPPAPDSSSDLPVSYTRRIPVRSVMRATTDYLGMSFQHVISDSRIQSLVRARQIGMYLAYHLACSSYPAIGRALGGRDHTTILHGKRTIAQLLDAGDVEVTAAVKAITARLEVAYPLVPVPFEEDPPPPCGATRVEKWSPRDVERLVHMRKENFTPKFIACDLGRSVEAIRNKAARLGYPFGRKVRA
jgi:hypothetical protein